MKQIYKRTLTLVLGLVLLVALASPALAARQLDFAYANEALSGTDSKVYDFRVWIDTPEFTLWLKNTGERGLNLSLWETRGENERQVYAATVAPGDTMTNTTVTDADVMGHLEYELRLEVPGGGPLQGNLSILRTAKGAQTPDLANLIEGELWRGDVWLEGTRDLLLDPDNRIRGYALAVDGVVYVPLFTAQHWLGKTGAWNPETRTATLSGTGPQKIYSYGDQWKQTEEEKAADRSTQQGRRLAEKLTDATLLVDGAPHTFRDAKGEVLPMLESEGMLFVPLRGLGDLMGLETTWASYGTAYRDHANESVYVRTHLTDGQKAEVQAYLDSAYALCIELDDAWWVYINVDKWATDARAQKETAVRAMDAALVKLAALKKPTAPIADAPYAAMQTAIAEGRQKLAESLTVTANGTFAQMEQQKDVRSYLVLGDIFDLQNAFEQKGFTDAPYNGNR